MKRRFHFHGEIGARFAPHYDLASPTVRKAVRLLGVQIPGFFEAVAARRFEIVRGTPGESGAVALDERMLDMKLGACRDIHLIPVIEGEGGRSGKAAAKVVLGVALIGTGIGFGVAAAGGLSATAFTIGGTGGLAVTYGNIVMTGAGLLLSGVSQLLSPQPGVVDYRTRETEKRESFLFNNGPVNLTEQGHPVPLIFGRFRVGGIPISAGLRVEETAA